MRIAIVHYHLRIGGVSRVIELACRALLQRTDVSLAVLAGDVSSLSPIPDLVPVALIPGLDYRDPPSNTHKTALLQELKRSACRLLKGPPDVWHLHNHSLGKNLALLEATARLAKEGHAMLLQIHDFAENQRLEDYQRLIHAYGSPLEVGNLLYPSTPRIAYALLNSRDVTLLKRIQFPGKLFLLPNPALPQPVTQHQPPKRRGDVRYITYPCRSIRRKNIGEALLFACALPKDRKLALAMPPKISNECLSYMRWKSIANRWLIPVEFMHSCPNTSIGDFISSSEALLTTSLEEGFGMVFLECWLFNKPLLGRDIPLITADLRSAGIVLDSLYDFLGIPVSLIGKRQVYRSLFHHLRQNAAAIGIPVKTQLCERMLQRALRGNQIDFGRLEPLLQERVLHLAAQSPSVARDFFPRPLTLTSMETIRLNCGVVAREYSLERYLSRLLEIYSTIVSAPSGAAGLAGNSLDIFKEFLLI
ncbi:MAG: glycosyltransferase [Candidatus Xiphinematobacter sp.]|nr:MAG: glycosyltransferase [Candidatus Xiphinematobacter sp.]